MSQHKSLNQILAVAQTGAGHQAIAAAVLLVAVADARRGDDDARDWIAGAMCLRWLEALLPDDRPEIDASDLQRSLIARAEGR